ncbi:dihydrolipoamide acyltransferase component E2, putative [Plasmodium malariae]|uniref:Dihydrolipoamide acetyltransferase component of pyruvate dehydrogenase complex n=1 Tax=Plasmodium malariae TaxID=5858 RepID=A0A1D3JJM6_PLAMA|nr:dihydrolipoamide acyltransferase component E2, putative [Plasmodium malariae]SBT86637.1 dihydrolipoamide acyltransferase component E2, putative [Plasmodium malariae]
MLCNIILLIFYLRFFKCISKNNKNEYLYLNGFSSITNNYNHLRSKKYMLYSTIEIKMPALSSTMTTGKIVKWNKNIGDYVNLGDIIMTVESDKADMDVEAFDEANVGDTLGVLTTEENEQLDEKESNQNDSNIVEGKVEEGGDEDKQAESNIYKKKSHVNARSEHVNEEKIFIPFIRSKKNMIRINKWMVKENEFINKDEVLMHVEDDKSTIEVKSPYSGVIKNIIVKEGEFAPINEEVAIISVNKEADKSNSTQNAHNNYVKKNIGVNENDILTYYKNKINGTIEGAHFLKNLTPDNEKILEERLKLNYDKYNHTLSDFFRSTESASTCSTVAEEEISKQHDVKIVLPSAAELMSQHKIKPSDITNTKVFNRITYEDVDAFLKNKKSTIVKDISTPQKEKLVELTTIQKSIKNNMMQTLSVPVFRVTHLIKTNELLKLYEQVKNKISMSVILNKCISTVLVKHPLIYSTYIDKDQGKILYNDDVNIGNALGLEDSLLTPVLKQVDKKDIYTLSVEWKKLVEKGKNGLLTSNDMSGSNFYISNLGMFNTYQFDAILPKNASCILSVGTNITSFENLEYLKIQKGMLMTLTCDHRHIYGSHAATFMKDLSIFIEKDIMQIFL